MVEDRGFVEDHVMKGAVSKSDLRLVFHGNRIFKNLIVRRFVPVSKILRGDFIYCFSNQFIAGNPDILFKRRVAPEIVPSRILIEQRNRKSINKGCEEPGIFLDLLLRPFAPGDIRRDTYKELVSRSIRVQGLFDKNRKALPGTIGICFFIDTFLSCPEDILVFLPSSYRPSPLRGRAHKRFFR